MGSNIKLQEALDFAINQNDNASLWMSKIDNKDDIYLKVLIAYISVIIEHHKSITELIKLRQESALCLLRPLYEAYLRVHWLCLIEDSKKVDKAIEKLIHFNDNSSFPSLKIMCEQIDIVFAKQNEVEESQVFLNQFENNKKLMHSYSHSGGYLIPKLINETDTFICKDMISVLNSSTQYLLSSISVLSARKHNIDLFMKVNKEIEEQTKIFEG